MNSLPFDVSARPFEMTKLIESYFPDLWRADHMPEVVRLFKLTADAYAAGFLMAMDIAEHTERVRVLETALKLALDGDDDTNHEAMDIGVGFGKAEPQSIEERLALQHFTDLDICIRAALAVGEDR